MFAVLSSSIGGLTPEEIEILVQEGSLEFTMDSEPVKGPSNEAHFNSAQDARRAMEILGWEIPGAYAQLPRP